MDADQIRFGETGFEELLSWLRGAGHPQKMETLSYQYIAILHTMVREEEEEA